MAPPAACRLEPRRFRARARAGGATSGTNQSYDASCCGRSCCRSGDGALGIAALIASQASAVGEPDGYGALFCALGAGAIVGAGCSDRSTSLSTNGILVAAGSSTPRRSRCHPVPSFSRDPGDPGPQRRGVDGGDSTLQAELQLVLPAWVRARGVALYIVTFTGSQTAGALLWGSRQPGRAVTDVLAAGRGCSPAVAASFLRVPETGHLDPQPAVYWSDARLAFDPEPDTGPF